MRLTAKLRWGTLHSGAERARATWTGAEFEKRKQGNHRLIVFKPGSALEQATLREIAYTTKDVWKENESATS